MLQKLESVRRIFQNILAAFVVFTVSVAADSDIFESTPKAITRWLTFGYYSAIAVNCTSEEGVNMVLVVKGAI